MKLWAQLVWLLVLHVAIPTAKAASVGPQFLGRTPSIAGSGANRIFVQDHLAYVAAGTNGLMILDISNPLRATHVGALRSGGVAVDVFVRRSIAFVAFAATIRDAGSVQLINVKDPASPQLIGSRRGETQGVVATDNHMYTVSGNGGMAALEYSNPAKPNLTGGYDTPRNATSLRIFDNRLYVTDSFAA